MKITKLSIQGSNAWNEDALVSHKGMHMYGVIDGATSLVPFIGEKGETGGYLASQIIATSLETSSDTLSLPEALLEANQKLKTEMLKCGIDISKKEELWGACAVIIRIQEKSIDYVQAGDCMLLAIYQDGTIRIVTHDQIAHLDRETQNLWAEGVARGIQSRQELWNYVKLQILSGRQATNMASGYAVLNGEPELADHLEYGRLNRINLKALLLISDGMYVPKPANEVPFDAAEVASLVMEMGLERYMQWLINLEEQDPDCSYYPRVKKSDDKTAIWVEF